MEFILADGLSKTFGRGEAAVHAVDSVSFTLDEGDFVAIMGESGAGKSTLLSILGAMSPPTTGSYTVDGIDVYDLSIEQQADFRREYLGFVFQSFHLVPYLTVVENVLLPLTGVKARRSDKQRMAMSALEWVGLTGKARRLPHQISGGEKERVAIARAIVNDPPILLADEPTGSLDTRTSGDIMQLLTRLNSEGMAIIMVTHSPISARHADRLLVLSDGRLEADTVAATLAAA